MYISGIGMSRQLLFDISKRWTAVYLIILIFFDERPHKSDEIK